MAEEAAEDAAEAALVGLGAPDMTTSVVKWVLVKVTSTSLVTMASVTRG